MFSVNPIALWPLNSRYGFADVIGGKNGTGYDVSLDSNSHIDFSDVERTLPSRLFGVYEDKSYLFKGSSGSYIQIPGIPMANDITIVSFIKPVMAGPIFQWDPSGVWGDHFWVINTGSTLFFRPVAMRNKFGSSIRMGEYIMYSNKDSLSESIILYIFGL